MLKGAAFCYINIGRYHPSPLECRKCYNSCYLIKARATFAIFGTTQSNIVNRKQGMQVAVEWNRSWLVWEIWKVISRYWKAACVNTSRRFQRKRWSVSIQWGSHKNIKGQLKIKGEIKKIITCPTLGLFNHITFRQIKSVETALLLTAHAQYV